MPDNETRQSLLTIVVPSFNERENVAPLVKQLNRVLLGVDADILYIDDSTDDTPDVVQAVASWSRLPLRVLHRETRTGGLAGAVAEGIRDASGEYIVVMDGDLQHPADLVPILLNTAVNESMDLVVASRYLGEGEASGLTSAWRRSVSSVSTVLARRCFPHRVGRSCTDPMTGFFCVRRDAVDLGRLHPRGFKILLEILARHELRVTEVPFVFGQREGGKSKASWKNGLLFLYQMGSLRMGRLARFAAVGGLGTVVNLLVMSILVHLAGLNYLVAAVLATELSIVQNVLMQERFVFEDVRDGVHSRRSRLAQSITFNNVETAVRLPFLVLLVSGLGLYSVAAQALTLAVAFAARFVFLTRVVYRPQRGAYPRRHAAVGTPALRLTRLVARFPLRGKVAVPASNHFAVPPNDEEKYHYIGGVQHRWFWWAHALSFAGIAFSLYGFARMQYWTLIALVPLALYAGETLLGLRTSTFRRSVTLPDHQFLVETWAPSSYPPIDVFLPTAGEEAELLENTYRHVAQLEWPGELRIHVLDDSGRDEVAALASRYGFGYFARPGSEYKKAGNLRYAFERTCGDHILILDADFVPRKDALYELVPYFDDETVGIVQSPQYFATPKSMNWLQRGAGATQEVFYRFIQVSRDSVGAAICCGTSALYRRSALDAIGGFPKIAHSEDVFTGFEMDKVGYRLRYVPVNVTQGICPDEINGFITQQYRWCEGSAELACGADFHTHPSLTSKMRLSFWSGFFYYGTTAMNGFFAPIPILIMVWIFPQYVHASNFVPLIGLFVLWLVVYPALLKTRWRLETLRVQTIYAFTHAVAIYDVCFAGNASEWVPSHGSEHTATPLAIKVKRIMATYLSVTMSLAVFGLAYRLSEAEYHLSDWWPGMLFLAANVYVFLPVVWLAMRKPAPAAAQPVSPADRQWFEEVTQ
jgi:cellulose synthase (UDP-forming)